MFSMAGSSVQDVRSTYSELLSEWSKANPDIEKCGKLLAALKVCKYLCGTQGINAARTFASPHVR
jgi:hypothetical protein